MKRLGITLLTMVFTGVSLAERITADDAKFAVGRWLELVHPSICTLTNAIESVESMTLSASTNEVHIVRMKDNGFVITSADEGLEPVLAFSDAPLGTIDRSGPLYQLLSAGVERRVKTLGGGSNKPRLMSSRSQAPTSEQMKAKWLRLLRKQPVLMASSGVSQSKITDMWCPPLLKTVWGQTTVGSDGLFSSKKNCYNYYTPNKCPCGCVATAMAQLMRYHQWPVDYVEPQMRWCSYADEWDLYSMIGGYYFWAEMPSNPDDATSSQRSEIGKLTYDCGVAVGMMYGKNGSGAYLQDVPDALTTVFGYANAKYVNWSHYYCDDDSERLRANLNARSPVLLGIRGDGGHAVVADGYGRTSDETEYVHLNMGWDGSDNLWYNLPDIGTSYQYDEIDEMVCDVFPTETGRIFSGRVLSEDGSPVKGVIVSIMYYGKASMYENTSNLVSVVTDENGIYSAIVPDNSEEAFYGGGVWWGEAVVVDRYGTRITGIGNKTSGFESNITIPSLATAIDVLDLPYWPSNSSWCWHVEGVRTGGTASWESCPAVGSRNGTVARSTNHGGKSESWIEMEIGCTRSDFDRLTFDWKVVSETGCDFLRFSIDGKEVCSISGTNSWRTVTCYHDEIDDGLVDFYGHSHVLRWTYSKDSKIDAGADCGWLDNVRFSIARKLNFSSRDWPWGDYQFSQIITAYTGDLFPEPPKPVRPGFVFSGWHLPCFLLSEDGVDYWYEKNREVDVWTEWTGEWVTNTMPDNVHIPTEWLRKYGLLTLSGDGLTGNPDYVANQSRGKNDAEGNPICIWQDFVAGCDPTNLNDRLEAHVAFSNDFPVVTWSPNLNTNGEVRLYKVWGKARLDDLDEQWLYPTNGTHRFFKVTVEMP